MFLPQAGKLSLRETSLHVNDEVCLDPANPNVDVTFSLPATATA